MKAPDDVLEHDERLRLEALAQAIISSGCAAGRPVQTSEVIVRAARFEEFIREGRS